MRRREFIGLLGGAAAAPMLSPFAVRAQQPKPVVGFLNGASSDLYVDRVRAFQQGLSEIGFVEGRNVTIEYRWAEGHYERLPALLADLTRRRVSVIAAGGRAAAQAAKAAAHAIPIVFTTADDPVEAGLVASLNRPGGNITGATNLDSELGPKRLELLHELVPAARFVTLLINLKNPNAKTLSEELQEAARALRLETRVQTASTEGDLDQVFTIAQQLGAGGLVVGSDAFFNEQLAALAVRHRIPTVHNSREFAAAGGLISYGGSGVDSYRQIGTYAGRILNGEPASDLPVQQSVKAELYLNLKTAKTLGISVPLSLLGRADEVIE
jgi:putative tryptophan/tyrosine transport system substrate-binding protein